ncbi:MAG: hypothetical protein KAV87_57735, partial [Desulfobacteraceae bacterium]|nr:hypothetical protein [Desulfobacteraceae bacterium]
PVLTGAFRRRPPLPTGADNGGMPDLFGSGTATAIRVLGGIRLIKEVEGKIFGVKFCANRELAENNYFFSNSPYSRIEACFNNDCNGQRFGRIMII